jgi:spore coat polysaccharide biosynthesis protein SpsF
MKTVAIIQARVSSSRLPRKVLEDISGRSMLERVVRATQRAKCVDSVVVATTVEPSDDAIVDECKRIGVASSRGDLDDVLDRYHQAAGQFPSDVIVRITSDCPLLDPGVIDEVLSRHREAGADYSSNGLIATFPRGLDVEAMSATALEIAWREARLPYERSHVTPYFYQHPERFRIVSVETSPPFPDERWTVDTREDLALVREIVARLPDPDRFTWRDVIEVLDRTPGLREINRNVRQKALEEG